MGMFLVSDSQMQRLLANIFVARLTVGLTLEKICEAQQMVETILSVQLFSIFEMRPTVSTAWFVS
jgi:hypothetical protein